MIDVAIGVIINYLYFGLIGVGPCLFFCSSRRYIENTISLAPVLGFALTSIVGTYLVLLDMPVSEWAVTWLVVAILISNILLFSFVFKERNAFNCLDTRCIALYMMSLVATIIILLLPVLLGGVNFTALRGNGTDALNYISVAGYLDHEPYSWLSKANIHDAIDLHPSYSIVRGFLGSRWATSMSMAWSARIAGLSLVQFEYGFTLLPFILAFGPAFLIARELGIRPFYAVLTSSVVCVGFWAQFVLDIRAMSQISSIPLLLFLSLIIIWIENEVTSINLREQVLLSVIALALVFQYCEVVPLAILGMAVFIGLRMIHGSYRVIMAVGYLLSLAITTVLAIPAGSYLMSFFIQQMQYAATTSNTWDKAYFSWLYSNPFTGLWGLSVFSRGLMRVPLTLLGILLSGMLICSILYVLSFREREHSTAFRIVVSFVVSAFVGFLYLFTQGQLWAAGKAISFGYAFIMIAVVGFVFLTPLHTSQFWLKMGTALRVIVSTWLIIQFVSGIMRARYAYTGEEYSHYIVHHGEYKRHDLDIANMVNVLKRAKCESVGLAVYNVWLAEYLELALGGDLKVINFEGVFDKNRVRIGFQQFINPPEYMIISKDTWIDKEDITRYGIAYNSELALLRVTQEFWARPVLVSLHNPNGIESSTSGESFFWMGGDEKTLLRLYVPKAGEIILSAKFSMGPSLPERDVRTVEVTAKSTGQSDKIQVTESTGEIRIPVIQGMNDITMRVIDKPSVDSLPNGDRRPLLLNVSGVKVAWLYENVK